MVSSVPFQSALLARRADTHTGVLAWLAAGALLLSATAATAASPAETFAVHAAGATATVDHTVWDRMLASYVGERTSGRLFLGARGEPLTTRHVQRRFAQVRAEAGIPSEVRLHTLRATFAQDLLERTQGDLLLVSKALGHRSIGSTLRYVTASEDRLRTLFHGLSTSR